MHLQMCLTFGVHIMTGAPFVLNGLINANLKLSQIINFNAISIWIFSLVCLYQFFTREITTLSTMR